MSTLVHYFTPNCSELSRILPHPTKDRLLETPRGRGSNAKIVKGKYEA